VLVALQDRSAFFVAKTLANMLYLMLVAVCTVPLFGVWFRLDVFSCLGSLGLILGLGMLGLSAVGTLFSLIVLNIRTREILLPLLFLPVSVPLTIAAVYATAKLIAGNTLAEITDYLTLMGVFDVVFVVLALLLCDFIVED
jgi:heme exporter protein B